MVPVLYTWLCYIARPSYSQIQLGLTNGRHSSGCCLSQADLATVSPTVHLVCVQLSRYLSHILLAHSGLPTTTPPVLLRLDLPVGPALMGLLHEACAPAGGTALLSVAASGALAASVVEGCTNITEGAELFC